MPEGRGYRGPPSGRRSCEQVSGRRSPQPLGSLVQEPILGTGSCVERNGGEQEAMDTAASLGVSRSPAYRLVWTDASGAGDD